MPVRLDVCGLLLALSVTVSVPVKVSSLAGENVTLMVQLFPLSKAAPQVEAETANGADAEYEMPVRVVGRLFFNVNFFAALVVPTFLLGNV